MSRLLAPEVVADWWQQVLRSGELPTAATPVVGRLIRQVGRIELDGATWFVKVMTFPRSKDRLRYLVRRLPAAHEARMLQRVRAAGVVCPRVAAVRCARRFGLPFRSMLVLEGMPLAADVVEVAPEQRLAQRAAIAGRLVGAALFHPDLHPDNFLELADGTLALLDLQSMRRVFRPGSAARQMAARLLLEAEGVEETCALDVLVQSGLVRAADRDEVRSAAVQIARAFLRKRMLRCFTTSTDFVRRLGWGRVENRRRGAMPPGRWVVGGADLRDAWVADRALEVLERRSATLWGLRRGLLWSRQRACVYVLAPVVEQQLEEHLNGLREAMRRYEWLMTSEPGAGTDLELLRRLRRPASGEARS